MRNLRVIVFYMKANVLQKFSYLHSCTFKSFDLFTLLEYKTLEMFQERLKSKYKFGGTKVYKAEETRIYFVNPKTESFLLVCKLHYL